MHAAPLPDDGDMTPGHWVIHVGYPRGYAKNGPGYVRLGRVVERVQKGEIGTLFLDDVGVAGGVACVLPDGRELTGSVVATEPRYDLALVVAQATDLMPVAWAKQATPAVGQWVVAAGPDRTAIAAGTVGAVDVDGPAHKTPGQQVINAGGLLLRTGSPERQGTGSRSYPKLVWHTAWLEAEQLGGPLVDLDGRALGIAIERPSHITGYMVPAAEVRAFLDKHAGAAMPNRRPSTDPAETRGGQ